MHLNLHKTFSTPHGGGGPGSGPVACKKILEPFLPTPVVREECRRHARAWTTTARNPSAGCACSTATSACSSARWPTSWPTAPMACARPRKMRCSTPTTSARSSKASTSCPTKRRRCTRWSSATSAAGAKGVKTGDIAKRLIDYGFHPYTVSFPLIVPGALMIEPTESESKEELDLFIDAMQQIAREVEENPDARPARRRTPPASSAWMRPPPPASPSCAGRVRPRPSRSPSIPPRRSGSGRSEDENASEAVGPYNGASALAEHVIR